ncbi:hypothetical protein [Massilia glaciei]|nr:hypothetical protein [Massilia glaciei]
MPDTAARAPGTLRGEQAWATAAFTLLFPGFFFYHTALGLGLSGAFLGGFFAIVALVFAPPLCFIYGYKLKFVPNFLHKSDVFFGLFLAYFLAVVAANAGAGANPAIVNNHLLGVLFMVMLFVIFRIADFDAPAIRRALLACLLGMSAVVFTYSVDGVFYLGALGVARDPQSLATYQGFSRSYLVTFMVFIPYTRALRWRALLYLLGAPTLFLNTARSEFVAMLFLIPIIELYYSKYKMGAVVLFILFLAAININIEALLSALPDNRMLELFDLSQSSSANKRHHLNVLGMQTIAANPIWGDYGSYAPGHYAHNVFSAWVDLGIFGFFFLLAVLIIPTIGLVLKGYFQHQTSGDFLLVFGLTCSTLLLLFTSHYFTDMMIGATLGAYSKYRLGRKYVPDSAPDFGPPPLRHPDFRQTVSQPGGPRS